MEQNLSQKQIKAARLVAADDLTDAQIATACGVGRTTLFRWGRLTAFQGLVQEEREKIRKQVMENGIADVVERTKRRNADWLELQRFQIERGKSEEMQGVVGGDTGLLVKRTRRLGRGSNARIVEDFLLDVSLLNQITALEVAVQEDLKQLG